MLRSIPTTSCNAHCPNQYEHLKQWLRIKEFTSIIDTTQHGIERLIERGFTPEEVYQTLYHPTMTKIQKDGAIAYIKEITRGFNVIIFNKKTKKIITPIKGADNHSLIKLGKNMDGYNIEKMYRCCFCTTIITTNNIDPCLIDVLININKPKSERYNQIFYSHLKCFEQQLHQKIRFYLALECLVTEDENDSNKN